jgi:hypothetical protein
MQIFARKRSRSSAESPPTGVAEVVLDELEAHPQSLAANPGDRDTGQPSKPCTGRRQRAFN